MGGDTGSLTHPLGDSIMSDPVPMASIQLPTPLFLTAQRLNTLEPRAQMSVRAAVLFALAYAAMLLFDAPNILLHVMLVPPCLVAAWFEIGRAHV